MGALNLLVIAGIRLALFAGCRLTLLPLLLGEARHASLDEGASDAIELGELPRPATTTTRSPSSARFTASASASSSSPRDLLNTVTDSLKDPHQASSHVFSLCFEESAILFALVLLEAMGTVPHELLEKNWTFSLIGVVALAVLLIPLGICLLVTFRFDSASPILKRALWALIPFVLWLILFLRVPLPPATAGNSPLLDGALSRTALLGVVLIALLSGSGATSAAWDTYEAFFAKRKPKVVTASELRDSEESFRRTCADLGSRRRALEALKSAPPSEAERQQQAGFFSRIWAGSQRGKEIKALSQEINGLEILASAMRDDLDSLRTRHRQALWSKTIQGRLLLGAGHLFSIYCVWRVLLAALSLVILGYRDQAPPDFVSLSLAHIVRLFNVDIDLDAWARIFGLLFVGALILVRMRVVLANLSTFFRAASAGISTSFLVLFLSEVLTIYLLATLIQLRASLPSALSGTPDDISAASLSPLGTDSSSPDKGPAPLLASLPSYNVSFGALFDASFLLAALATALARWFMAREEDDRANWGL